MSAKDWAQAGYKVFPLRYGTKVPACPHGVNDATSDYSKWVVQGYDMRSYGIACGDGLLVVDVDDEQLFHQSEWAESLPPTFMVKTPSGGGHLYFSTPENVKNAVKWQIWGDTRSLGGYVVGPGSPGYEALNEAPLAEAPEALIKSLRQAPAAPKPTTTPTGQGVVEGGRNAYLTACAGKMQRAGLLTFEGLMAVNEQQCSPPLPTKEVERITSNILKHQPSDPVQVPETHETACIPVASLYSELEAYLGDDHQKSGTSTGIPSLDELLGGGVRPGEVIGVLAPQKVGKSSFTHKMIHHWVKNGEAVGYASRELRPAQEVLPNLLSIELQKNVLKVGLKDEEVQEKTRTALTTWPLYFSRGYGFLSLEELERFYRDGYAAGIRIFVLDHLHHFMASEEHQETSRFAKRIKTLTIELGVTTILVIQPRTLRLDQTRITNNDIRGGAVVSQAVDAVIVLERMKDEHGKVNHITKVTLDIARHKLARLGDLYLSYDRDTMDYTEVEEIVPPTPESMTLESRARATRERLDRERSTGVEAYRNGSSITFGKQLS